jgi:hypothetical protein
MAAAHADDIEARTLQRSENVFGPERGQACHAAAAISALNCSKIGVAELSVRNV